MTREERRRQRYQRLQAAWAANLPALTILRAKAFLRRDADCWPVWITLGSALLRMGRNDDAEEAFTRAMTICPDENIHLPTAQMGHLFEQRGNFPQAEAWYRKTIDAAPDRASGHVFLGAILGRQGRLDEAEMSHRNATRCTEGCIDEAYLNLGFVLRARERLVESAECFARSLELDPENRRAKRALRDVRIALKSRRDQGS